MGTPVTTDDLNNASDAVVQTLASVLTDPATATGQKFESQAQVQVFAEAYPDLKTALDDAIFRGARLMLKPGKAYPLTAPYLSDADKVFIACEGGRAIVTHPGNSGSAIALGLGRTAAAPPTTLTANAKFGTRKLTVASTAGMARGHLLRMTSNKAWYNDPREDPTLPNDTSLEPRSSAVGFAQSGTSTTIRLRTGTTATANDAGGFKGLIGKSVTIRAGTGAGQCRRVINYDETTKDATVTPDWDVAPDATSSYIFPQITKGGLTCIEEVVDGTTLRLTDLLPDGYRIANEEVKIEAIAPGNYSVSGVRIQGPGGAGETIGLAVSNAYKPQIDIEARDVHRAGGAFANIYGGIVRIDAQRVNDTGTGYGAQVSACAHLTIDYADGGGGRRLLDMSGIIPSDNLVVQNFRCHGGGKQEPTDPNLEGAYYTPDGPISNFGVGTHGAARGTIFQNFVISGVRHGIYVRGRDTIIRNGHFGAGIVDTCVFHSFGGCLEIYGCTADAAAFDTVDGATVKEIPASAGENVGSYAPDFLRLGANIDQSSAVTLTGNKLRLAHSIVSLEPSIAIDSYAFPNLRAYDNDVEFFPLTAGGECCVLGRTGATPDARSFNLSGGRFDNDCRTASGNTGFLVFGSGVAFSNAAKKPTRFGAIRRVFLADQDVFTFPIGQIKDEKLRVSIAVLTTESYFFEGWVKKGSATLVQIAGANVEGFSIKPTGSSGTNGRLGLYFDGNLTIQNRLGANRTFEVMFWPTA